MVLIIYFNFWNQIIIKKGLKQFGLFFKFNLFLLIRNIGGREIYSFGFTVYPNLYKMVLTMIDKDFECDIKFPEIDWNKFIVDEYSEKIEDNGIFWKTVAYIYKP
jgi:hypothetical protein